MLENVPKILAVVMRQETGSIRKTTLTQLTISVFNASVTCVIVKGGSIDRVTFWCLGVTLLLYRLFQIRGRLIGTKVAHLLLNTNLMTKVNVSIWFLK